MNGFITKRLWSRAVLLLCGGAPLAAAGCYEYKDLVDPCYPDRYNNMARNEVNGALDAQVAKGHMLDQTVWNYDFDIGTDKLNAMGIDHLTILARRAPQPDTLLFLQTAQLPDDLTYDPANPDKLTATRQDLDARRAIAVQKFLLALTGGHCVYQVALVDPSPVGLGANPVSHAIRDLNNNHFKGTLPGGGGGGATGGGGTGGGGGGGGGSPPSGGGSTGGVQ